MAHAPVRRRMTRVIALPVFALVCLAGQPLALADIAATNPGGSDAARPVSRAAAAREARIRAALEANPEAVPTLADMTGELPAYNIRVRSDGLPSAAVERSLEALVAQPAWTDRLAAADKLTGSVPGLRIDDDPSFLTPRFVRSTMAFLTAPAAGGKVAPADVVARYINDHAALFEINPLEIPAARVARDYLTDHNGVTHLTFQQQIKGLDLIECEVRANVMPDGRLINISSTMLPRPEGDFAAPGFVLSAGEALVAAARHCGIMLGDAGALKAATQPAGLNQKTMWETPPGLRPDEPPTTERVYFSVTREDIRAAYSVLVAAPGVGHTYEIIVDAADGSLLSRHNRLVWDSTQPITFRVYPSDGVAPMSPALATPSGVQAPEVPRALLTVTPAQMLPYSPNGWIDDGNTETIGNNVAAHLDVNADNQPDLPRPNGGPSRVFDFPLDPSLSPTTYTDASVTQLFFLANRYHDQLYALGFNEVAGNFQTFNFGLGGVGNDAVQADCQDGYGLTTPNANNANFSTGGADGTSARVQMYIFTGPNPDRDGSLDGDIVIHELTHGTSIRLHGGLSSLQSRGMGEGWSDYFGVALLAEPSDDPDANYTTGGYTTYQLWGSTYTNNYYFGIRRYPYSTSFTANPLTFKFIDLAQLIYPDSTVPRNTSAIDRTGTPATPTVHSIGENWCNMLLEARANLLRRDGYAGNQTMLQLVVDGMKLSVGNPTFIQARDAVLQADMVNNSGTNTVELWSAFAKRGLGTAAVSPAASTTTGVIENYETPFTAVFSYPDGLPTQVAPASPATFRVQIVGLGVTLTPGEAYLDYTIGAGTPVTVALSPTATPDEYTVMLPAVDCFERIGFALRAGTSIGDRTDPPTGAFSVQAVTDIDTARFDDFETDTGWTVGPNTATAGIWVRANPVGTAAQPEDDFSPDGTICWVTGNGVVGGAIGAADVDGGFTTLTSPTIDLAGSTDARISYARWYSNGLGASPFADTFRIDVSVDNGGSWTNAETIGPGSSLDNSPQWRTASWRLSQFGLVPTAQVRVRFVADDAGAGSIVEAAIDDFRVESIDCVQAPTCPADFNDSGSITVQDIFDFLAAYFASEPTADFNDSGSITVQDIFDFLEAYFVGCP